LISKAGFAAPTPSSCVSSNNGRLIRSVPTERFNSLALIAPLPSGFSRMNKWTSEQRNRVIIVALGAVAVIALIWFGPVASLESNISGKAGKIAQAENQLRVTRASIAMEKQFQSEIGVHQKALLELEGTMAQGDLYRWVINLARGLAAQHSVN